MKCITTQGQPCKTRAAKFLELDDITLHDLRHEGISRLFDAGLSIPEVSLISGHTSWESLKRYTHIQPKHVLEKLGSASKKSATRRPTKHNAPP